MKKIFLLVTYFPTLFFSQGVYQDFGTWIKLNSNFKIDKKTSITNKTELRTFDNSQQINQIYTQFSYDKDLNKLISTSFAWRSKFINDEFSYVNSNRFHNDITFQKKYSNINIYFRLRSQFHIHPFKNNDWIERTRFKVKFKLSKKLSYYLYNEFYFSVNSENPNSYTKNRIGTGLKYRLSKKTDLEVKYLKISDVNIESPISLNVIGFKISNQFKK